MATAWRIQKLNRWAPACGARDCPSSGASEGQTIPASNLCVFCVRIAGHIESCAHWVPERHDT